MKVKKEVVYDLKLTKSDYDVIQEALACLKKHTENQPCMNKKCSELYEILDLNR